MIKQKGISLESARKFTLILAPYTPHAAEELWEKLGHKASLTYETWPKYDDELAKDDLITMAVQINGKTRATIEVAADISKDDFLKLAFQDEKIKRYLAMGEVSKEIYVPGRICNLIIKGAE